MTKYFWRLKNDFYIKIYLNKYKYVNDLWGTDFFTGDRYKKTAT